MLLVDHDKVATGHPFVAYFVYMETNKKNQNAGVRGLRLISLVLGVFFLAAGITKLMGTSMWAESFGRFHLPDWWVLYAVGSAEALGGLLLLLGQRRGFAAGLLAVVMLGAFLTHLRIGEFVLALFPAFLLVPLLMTMKAFRN